ncbi:MAG: ATP-binding protein [Planctomycetota bacterium]|jgi:anti-sigma regulatory factor (Ser/Thr protein kinase)
MSRAIQKTISMPCSSLFLQEVRGLLKDALSGTDVPRRKRDLIVLAVDEAVSSIVRYAKYKGYDHEISLSIDIDDVRFKAVLNDSLNVFEINGGLTEPEFAARVREEKAFTMGFFLIRKIMDEITYTYRKGFENTLEMISFL